MPESSSTDPVAPASTDTPWAAPVSHAPTAGPGDEVVIGVSFADRFRAQEFVTSAARLASLSALSITDVVVVDKDENGQVKVHESIDPSAGRSALAGGAWVGLLGLLVAGPVGWLAGIGLGAGAGAVTARLVDLGVPDDWVTWFTEVAKPATTTVVILAHDVRIDALADELARYPGAELVHTTLDASVIERLRAALGTSTYGA